MPVRINRRRRADRIQPWDLLGRETPADRAKFCRNCSSQRGPMITGETLGRCKTQFSEICETALPAEEQRAKRRYPRHSKGVARLLARACRSCLTRGPACLSDVDSHAD